MYYASKVTKVTGEKWVFFVPVTLSFSEIDDVLAYYFEADKKIDGIKYFREQYNTTLAVAKEVYEEYVQLKGLQGARQEQADEYISKAHSLLKEFN